MPNSVSCFCETPLPHPFRQAKVFVPLPFPYSPSDVTPSPVHKHLPAAFLSRPFFSPVFQGVLRPPQLFFPNCFHPGDNCCFDTALFFSRISMADRHKETNFPCCPCFYLMLKVTSFPVRARISFFPSSSRSSGNDFAWIAKF